MTDVVSIKRTIELSVGTVVLKRSRIIDAIRRDKLEDVIAPKFPGEPAYVRAFARIATQTIAASGLPFDPLTVDEGNAAERYGVFREMDETDIDLWFGGALAINAPIDHALASGIEVDDLKKKRTK